MTTVIQDSLTEPVLAEIARAKVLIAVKDSAGKWREMWAVEDGRSAAVHIMRLQREWGKGYTVGGFTLGTFFAAFLHDIAQTLDRTPLAGSGYHTDDFARGHAAGQARAAEHLRVLAETWKGFQP